MRPMNLSRLRDTPFLQNHFAAWEKVKARRSSRSGIRSDNDSISHDYASILVVVFTFEFFAVYFERKPWRKWEGECTPGGAEVVKGWWKRTFCAERPGLKNSIWNQRGYWEGLKGKEMNMRMKRVRYDGMPLSA
ncbi:MAG: hypothetical protein M1830_010393 [Pleopsidium flavum]|nr:MAG: hypothetical protein M1830_010393 [Pleopsidium flavum]